MQKTADYFGIICHDQCILYTEATTYTKQQKQFTTLTLSMTPTNDVITENIYERFVMQVRTHA